MPTQSRRWYVAKRRGKVLSPREFDAFIEGRQFKKKTESKALYRRLFSIIDASNGTPFNVDTINTILAGRPAIDTAPVKWAIDKGIKDRIFTCCPVFSLFLTNIRPGANAQIETALWLKKVPITINNIVPYKNKLRALMGERWTRPQTDDEKQGGNTVLGKTSENLLERAFESILDGDKFLRTESPEIKSYGDFILMALPNNLWISVKSGFSRERLLASGFSNDLIGVGFFQDDKEFTTESKVRNFKKVGFLAIYLPDSPVSPEQEQNQSNTYDLVKRSYDESGRTFPTNINGKQFFRKLSVLGNDLITLLDKPIETRTTIHF